MLFSLKALNL